MAALEHITERVSEAVGQVDDLLWRFELAALATQRGTSDGASANPVIGAIAQITAFKIAIATLGWLILRYGGTSPREARAKLASASIVAAAHGEDSTRTRHLRRALVDHQRTHPTEIIPLLLLGRPSSTPRQAFVQFDPNTDLGSYPAMRPLSLGSYLSAMPTMIGKMFRSIRQIARYQGAIPFRERIAISYRMAQGAVHAHWWGSVSNSAKVGSALFAHTGNADTSQLERAMQAEGIATAHVAHGTNIGWPFAGLSDVAVFPSGADANLGATLPAYGRCITLPFSEPTVSAGNGNWALLTSYTHLQHPAYHQGGADADIALVEMVGEAAKAFGQEPAKVFWRPHPQIDLVDPSQKARLEAAVAKAGFTRWQDEMPYEELGAFSAVVTSPSTVLTDALRRGQPAIVASVTPLQSDLLYTAYPLLVENAGALREQAFRILSNKQRETAYREAWAAIQPGGAYSISALIDSLHHNAKFDQPHQ